MKAREFMKNHLKRSLQRTHVLTGVLLAFIVGSAILYAGEIYNSLIQFNAGDVASASQVNANFQNLADAVDAEREGLACRIDTYIAIPTSGTTEVPFVCQTTLESHLSSGIGSFLYVAPEKGIYRIHRSLFVDSSSSAGSPYLDSNMYSKVYIDGTVDTSSREVYELDTGQTVDIMLIDPSTFTANYYYIREDSLVFVKRIF